MKPKSVGSLSVAAVFAFTIGMIGLTPSAVADEWNIPQGFAASNFFGTGPFMDYPAISTDNTVTKSGASVDLSLTSWNGFEADNYFGTGFAANNIFGTEHSQELSTTNEEFRAFAIQMSAEAPNSVSKSGTAVDLSLTSWNGFEADNSFFGTGLN